MTQALDIPEKLPSLNDIMRARGRAFGNGRKRLDGYAVMKRDWHQRIGWMIVAARLKPMTRVFIRFTWREANRKRDLDNIVAGGVKLILDSLVDRGILPGDGWANVVGFHHEFVAPSTPGVLITLEERA